MAVIYDEGYLRLTVFTERLKKRITWIGHIYITLSFQFLMLGRFSCSTHSSFVCKISDKMNPVNLLLQQCNAAMTFFIMKLLTYVKQEPQPHRMTLTPSLVCQEACKALHCLWMLNCSAQYWTLLKRAKNKFSLSVMCMNVWNLEPKMYPTMNLTRLQQRILVTVHG